MVNVHENYYMRHFRDNKVPYNSQTIIPIPFHSWLKRLYITIPMGIPWDTRELLKTQYVDGTAYQFAVEVIPRTDEWRRLRPILSPQSGSWV